MNACVLRLFGRLVTLAFIACWWAVIWVSERWPDGASNCLLWAVRQQRRHGGRFLVQRSAFGPWCHVQWVSRAGAVREFDPPEKMRRRLPPLLFAGTVVRVGHLALTEHKEPT